MVEPASMRRLGTSTSQLLADVKGSAQVAAGVARELVSARRNARSIGAPAAASLVLLAVSVTLLCLMTVQLLIWAFQRQPIWAAYGEIGLVTLSMGFALMLLAGKRMEALDRLDEQSLELAQKVSDAADHAEDAVGAVRDLVNETAEVLQEVTNVDEHFKKRPWVMIAGAVALGYAGGALLRQKSARRAAAPMVRQAEEAVSEYARTLEPEITRLKSLALGALFGALREFVATTARSATEPLEQELEDLIDGIKVKLGGTPMQSHAPHHGNGARKHARTEGKRSSESRES